MIGIEEKRAKLTETLRKHEEKAKKTKEKLKQLDKGPSKAQIEKIENAYGKAALILIENNEELAEMFKATLEEMIAENKRGLRKLLGLSVPETTPATETRRRRSKKKNDENADGETTENME